MCLTLLTIDQDGAEPSGNSVAAVNLVRLASLLNRQDWQEKAEKLFNAFSQRLKKIPMALPEMISGLLLYHKTPKQVILDCSGTVALPWKWQTMKVSNHDSLELLSSGVNTL